MTTCKKNKYRLCRDIFSKGRLPLEKEYRLVWWDNNWILPLQSHWFSIAVLSSLTVSKPVSSSKVCTYVVLGHPLLVCTCCSCHNTSFDASSSSPCLSQCPATLIRLFLILLQTFGKWPYGSSFVMWSKKCLVLCEVFKYIITKGNVNLLLLTFGYSPCFAVVKENTFYCCQK